MLKLTLTLILVVLFSGCGEDNATESRQNFITMINATQNSIVSNFNGSRENIAPKKARDELISIIGEAPEVSYNNRGEVILHQNENPRVYIATPCNENQYMTHNAQKGELHIVNTRASAVDIRVNNMDFTIATCSYILIQNLSFNNNRISITMDEFFANITPSEQDIYETVIFSDESIKSFQVISESPFN